MRFRNFAAIERWLAVEGVETDIDRDDGNFLTTDFAWKKLVIAN